MLHLGGAAEPAEHGKGFEELVLEQVELNQHIDLGGVESCVFIPGCYGHHGVGFPPVIWVGLYGPIRLPSLLSGIRGALVFLRKC